MLVKKLNTNIVGRRIMASILELVLWGIIFTIAAHMFGTEDIRNTTTTSTNLSGEVVDQSQGVYYTKQLQGLPALVFFGLSLLYFVIFESKFGGTLSKLLLGIRVVTMQGENITIQQSIVRNLLRIIDSFPYFIPNLAGFVILSTNLNKQRFGDKIAKTLVIEK